GTQVDGNDVVDVYEATCAAVETARQGGGPSFIECMTYRQRGHVGPSDNIQGTKTDIRPSSEIAEWQARDPLARLEGTLLRNGWSTPSELNTIRDAIAV